MLRHANFTRQQLYAAWDIVNERIRVEDWSITLVQKTRSHLFGTGTHEFLSEDGAFTIPHPNRLPTDNFVYSDSLGRLYYPSDPAISDVDTTIDSVQINSATWFVKITVEAVRTYRSSDMYDASTVQLPGPSEKLWITSLDKTVTYSVVVQEVIERREASCLIRLDRAVPTFKNGSGDQQFFYNELNKILAQ